jgi:predicted nucleic acid-binding protein
MTAVHSLSQQPNRITHNTREFPKVPGLNVDNWATSASIEPGS